MKSAFASQPGVASCLTDKGDDVRDGGIREGEIGTRDEAVDAWDRAASGHREVNHEALFAGILSRSYADQALTVNGEGRGGEGADHEIPRHFLGQ